MNSSQIVSFPNELLEKFTIESTIFPPENEKNGVAILSEVENTDHIVRIYQLKQSFDGKEYHVIQEVAAFRYKNRGQLDDFLARLPNMSALEMLMMLHPIVPFPSLMN